MPNRCSWCGEDPVYIDYHDKEWGVPQFNDHKLFEFLILESFQAGLSWITILKKRENFREAFDNFNYRKIAAYDDNKFNELIRDTGIIRNKLKIRAAVNNAQIFLKVQGEFGSFSNYIWGFVNHKPVVNQWRSQTEIPSRTELSNKISEDLKKRGFKFVGSTIIYAYMQAVGMVNDHVADCFRYEEV